MTHTESNFGEWGESTGALLDPGEYGRDLSLSLSPTLGASFGSAERLWDVQTKVPGG